MVNYVEINGKQHAVKFNNRVAFNFCAKHKIRVDKIHEEILMTDFDGVVDLVYKCLQEGAREEFGDISKVSITKDQVADIVADDITLVMKVMNPNYEEDLKSLEESGEVAEEPKKKD